MITEKQLRSTYHRIKDLKKVREETWQQWHVLNDKEQRSKEEAREYTRLFSTINTSNYEIRGLEISFKKISEQFIKQIVEV